MSFRDESDWLAELCFSVAVAFLCASAVLALFALLAVWAERVL